ncbi:hypothetical protein Q5444_08920 [Escherichia coli]|nr:hypothetical protein [Escherichia coli]MED8077271.1 hypothetical protein [Escherichia coli]MED8115859.1 hypothetical protein [Escherichia coli]MED8120804.1 hypothetical protein [Escherichia coli]MED8125641.1 hypothetical protein [Escherichia coli]
MTTKIKTSSWVIFTIATCYFMTTGSNIWESVCSAFAVVAVIKGILHVGGDILTQLSGKLDDRKREKFWKTKREIQASRKSSTIVPTFSPETIAIMESAIKEDMQGTFSQYLKAMESGDWEAVEALRTKQKDLGEQQRETIGYWKEHGVVVKYEDQWDF